METFIPLLTNVIIFVALAIPGYLLAKFGVIKEAQSGVLSKVLMYLGLPFLIFTSTVGINFNEELIGAIFIVLGFGLAFTIALFFSSTLLIKKSKNSSNDEELIKKKNGVLRFAAIFSNNGFLGLPLASVVFGTNSPVFLYVVLLNIITNTLLYTIGIYLISGDKKSISFKSILTNPVVIAFVIGIIFNLLNAKSLVPQITTYSTYFSNLVTPISMIIMGIKLGGIKIQKLVTSPKMYYASAIKLIAVPAIAVAISLLLGLEKNITLGIFIGFAMPTAALATAFADRFNGDTENAVIYTLGTTLLSIITIPVLYYLLCLII